MSALDDDEMVPTTILYSFLPGREFVVGFFQKLFFVHILTHQPMANALHWLQWLTYALCKQLSGQKESTSIEMRHISHVTTFFLLSYKLERNKNIQRFPFIDESFLSARINYTCITIIFVSIFVFELLPHWRNQHLDGEWKWHVCLCVGMSLLVQSEKKNAIL